MTIRLRLFAMQREQAGTREVSLDLPGDATIEDAWAALVGRFPVLAPGRAAVRFARNGEYSDPSTPLEDGDELAVIPPVSGGAEADAVGRILELRATPFGTEILGELTDRLADDADGGIVGFLGRTRRTPGTPAGPSKHSSTRLTRRWSAVCSPRSPTRWKPGSGSGGSRSSIGPARCPSAT